MIVSFQELLDNNVLEYFKSHDTYYPADDYLIMDLDSEIVFKSFSPDSDGGVSIWCITPSNNDIYKNFDINSIELQLYKNIPTLGK